MMFSGTFNATGLEPLFFLLGQDLQVSKRPVIHEYLRYGFPVWANYPSIKLTQSTLRFKEQNFASFIFNCYK